MGSNGVSPSQAIDHAMQLLDANPVQAERQAREVLKVLPSDARALFVIGAARRRAGDPAAARAVLETVVAGRPNAAHALHELGLAMASLGEGAAALAMLRRATLAQQGAPPGWGAFARSLDPAAGAAAGAGGPPAGPAAGPATGPAGGPAAGVPPLQAAYAALQQGRPADAERLVQPELARDPDNAPALHLLGEAKVRLGQRDAAGEALARCLALAPSLRPARHTYALVLSQQQRYGEAVVQAELLLAEAPAGTPEAAAYRELLANCLSFAGDTARAMALFEGLLTEQPARAKLWTQYGQALRIVGRGDDAVAAFRRAIALDPGYGDAYWSLADLRTAPLTPAEVAGMHAQLATPTLALPDRVQLHYALGRVLEEARDWAGSFAHFAQGAALRRQQVSYDADRNTTWVALTKALFTPAFFAARAAAAPRPDGPVPIFVVGLPRAGSTLVEQILASHSQVEATMELAELSLLNTRLIRAGRSGDGLDYGDVVAGLDAAALAGLGAEYLARTGAWRRLGRAYFVDKMPSNFYFVGLIHLLLPQAKIVDVRRHPMAGGFAAFKQYFYIGQDFSYSLSDIGRYYRDYVELMAHFDTVLPGRVHRVVYEDLVADAEAETRRLLAHCGLAFEPACLRFWEGGRVVTTHSSQQVRQPIFRGSLEQWHNYAPWLQTLQTALGPALHTWRGGDVHRRHSP